MPSGQAMIDALNQYITPTMSSMPTFNVNMQGIFTTLNNESLQMHFAGQRERLDIGNMNIGGNLLETQVKLTAFGTELEASLSAPPTGRVDVFIAFGGGGLEDPNTGDASKGADAKISIQGVGDALAIAIGGPGTKGRDHNNPLHGTPSPGSNGFHGSDGGEATVVAGNGCDIYAYSGKGGHGTAGVQGQAAVPPTPTPSWLIGISAWLWGVVTSFLNVGQGSPAIPSGNGGDGGDAGGSIIVAGDGVFAEGVAENGGDGAAAGITSATFPPGTPGTAGNGGNVRLQLGLNSTSSANTRAGNAGAGTGGVNGQVL